MQMRCVIIMNELKYKCTNVILETKPHKCTAQVLPECRLGAISTLSLIYDQTFIEQVI